MGHGRGSKITKRFYNIMIDEITLLHTNPHLRVFVDMGPIESNLFIKKYLSADVIDKSSDSLIFTQLSDENTGTVKSGTGPQIGFLGTGGGCEWGGVGGWGGQFWEVSS